jgi:hypothetical protein
VQRKSARLYFKSLGGILALQESVANQFLVLKGFAKPAAVVVAPSQPPADPVIEVLVLE